MHHDESALSIATPVGDNLYWAIARNGTQALAGSPTSVMHKLLFDLFARSYEPPQWIVEDLEASPDPTVRAAMADALAEISSGAIESLDDDTHAQLAHLFHNKSREARARLHVLSRRASSDLQRVRMENLGDSRPRPSPYDLPVLAHLDVDEDGLVPLAAFDIQGDALCCDNHAFFIVQTLPAGNVNYWLLQELARAGLTDSVRVRLDPLLHGPLGELGGHFFKMDMWGRQLDWQRIRSLREVEQGRWKSEEHSSVSGSFTDFAWTPGGGEVSFTCEELPLPEDVQLRGARYLHAVYDIASDQLIHLDGAIRAYTGPELEDRLATHVWKAGKVGLRRKVFRTDHPIDTERMGALVQAFFVWNSDVSRYFGPAGPNSAPVAR